MNRIFLVSLTNISVLSIISIISCLFGIHFNKLTKVIISTFLFGFGGAFVSLLFSKRISMFSTGSKIIVNPKNKSEKWILKIIKKQSSKLKLKTPETAIYQSDNINAFATGPTKNSSLISVSSGLLKKMPKNEIKAVIAHEMTHISNGDMVTMTLIQGTVNTFVIFLSKIIIYFLSNIYLKDKKKINFLKKKSITRTIFSFFLQTMFGIFSSIVVMWFSRNREFYADAGSAKLVGRKNMIAALKKLKLNSKKIVEPKNISSLCIDNNYNPFLNLLKSHPPLDSRIDALNKKKYM
ncbi:MAG: protease HtpX [Buchnera aphidicola (Periphyllus lyropictus)]|uniref:protease HtpX n=1 Tax=Buchnera aphidicola TaxID=9 RepID=UPI001EB51016|nr:protease HtpX [Buchnera aphidicola]NIH16815.1 protease HtpX [Buchnera aphidicola (Periphyllus lyropictus)]USS94498.1 protease HtpX [Buchnera aphidicola (Periphyllus lyropictus)]